MRKLINKKKGFTLVELLVVVAILGILMLLALPRFMDSTKGSKVRTFEANVRTLLSMANQYSADRAGTYTGIESATSDVKKMADSLLGKPDGAKYTVTAIDLKTELDLATSNIRTGKYTGDYIFKTGKFTVGGTLPANIPASFKTTN